MESHCHCKECSCGHKHKHPSDTFKRWIISLFLICLALFLLKPFLIQQLQMRANAYLSASSFQEAIRICKKINRIAPQNGQAWSSLGYAFKESHELDKAAKAYEKAYKINPKDKKGKFDLAMIFFLKKDYLKAIPYFEELRNAGPDQQGIFEFDILNFYHSSLLKLKECYLKTNDTSNLKKIKEEIQKNDSSQKSSGNKYK